jgi:hypothetical protein
MKTIKNDEETLNGGCKQHEDIDVDRFHNKIIDVFSKFVPRKYLVK